MKKMVRTEVKKNNLDNTQVLYTWGWSENIPGENKNENQSQNKN